MTKFESLPSLGRRALPNQFDLIALALIFGAFVAVGEAARGLNAPLAALPAADISLGYDHLPYYALRTTLRMFSAIAAALLFTFTYATLAAKSRRAETVLIPVLDILQSVRSSAFCLLP